MKQQNKTLGTLLASMDAAIQSAQNAELADTVALLRLARLDLLMRANGVASDDIALVPHVMEHNGDKVKSSLKGAKKAETRSAR